jgi:hypothetical protein
MKPMPSIWLDTLTSFDDALYQIEACLAMLKENAESADFLAVDIKNRYRNDVMYMKQLFEKAETVARGR